MIIDCIGCLHGARPKLEGGDLLIVTGDLTSHDEIDQYCDFFDWLALQNYSNKIFIAGNHDNRILDGLEFSLDYERIEYLEDSGLEIEGLKVWGSPWSSQFPQINPRCCAFTRPVGESLQDLWDMIPDDVDILVTHTPPYGILDGITFEDGTDFHVGSFSLLGTLEKRIKPKLHVFSHIHDQGGKQMIYKRPGHGTENNTICVNASIMNDRYQPVNKPVRIIL